MPASPSRRSRKQRRFAIVGALVTTMLLVPAATSSAWAEPQAEQEQANASAPLQAAAPATLSLSAATAITGEKLTVKYATDQLHAENWVGIYPETVAPGDSPSLLWKYTPEASGSTSFTLDLQPGTYHVWFLARGGYDAITDKQVLTVTADPQAPAPLEPGDPLAPVTIDPVTTTVATDGVIMREFFTETSLPEGWITAFASPATGNPAYAGWQQTTRSQWSENVDEMRDRFGRTDRGFMVADAQQFGADYFEASLTSAPVDVHGLDRVRLTFDSHYRGAPGQTGEVFASFDEAEPVQVLSLDETTVTSGYDGMQMNAAQDLMIEVPAKAKTVQFTWSFTGGEGAHYWGIDSVLVHQVQAATSVEPTQAWVVSDIQGHPADFAVGLQRFAELSPKADGLLMVGDIVNSGSVQEWREIYDVMNASEAYRPRQTVATMGNHERYASGGFDANFARFLEFAERDKAWGEYVLEGPAGDLPVIVLGQEIAGPSDVPMTEEQVRFLEERLAHWTALDKQVLVLSHFPLGNTVSASWLPWYSKHHMHNDRLTNIMVNYPNAIMLSGHTHYPAELGDWSMQRRSDRGHPDGFWAINTLAMHIEWDARGENTSDITEVTTGDINRGLTLDSYGDRVVITAYDFASNTELRQVTIANPLVDFTAELAPDEKRAADYSGITAALASVPQHLDRFTPRSVKPLEAAIAAVVYDLTADRQAEVDAMAQAIISAIAGLTPSEGTATGPETPGDKTDDGAPGGGAPNATEAATDGALAQTGLAGYGWGIAAALALLAA
ncbi:MAG: DUF4073 domain-containing protein, partial [Microbacteriaceae bacterium]